jgi:hypothetical protein
MHNGVGENSDPVNIFFRRIAEMSKEATLYCFFAYYREVLVDPKEQTTKTSVTS